MSPCGTPSCSTRLTSREVGSRATRPSRSACSAGTPARGCSSSASRGTAPAGRCRGWTSSATSCSTPSSGSGTLELEGEPHDFETESGAYVRAGETYVIDNPGPDDLLVVSTTVPVENVYRPPREVIVRLSDRPELRADDKRTFRYLVDEQAGCMDATQFMGIVQPCRAPDHSHSYDELGYIVEGQGFAHIEGESIPLRPGSCFHLPPEQVHCIENTGPGVMRILGVFHPSGDPASRAYEDDSELLPAS